METVGRLAVYAGVAWLVGLLVVSRVVLTAVPGATAGTRWGTAWSGLVRRLVRSVDAAALAAVAGTAALLALQVRRLLDADLARDAWDAAQAVLATRFGQVTLLRGIAVVALWVALRGALGRFVVDPGPVVPASRQGRVVAATWLVLGVAVLLTLPLSGHAAAGPQPALWTAVGAVHAGAAAVWTTGVVALGLVLPAALGGQRGRTQAQVLAPVFARFARLAAVTVAVLVVTGVATAAAAVDSAADLRGTDYGRALLVKVWVVLVALGVGALNHLVLVPRLVRAVTARRPVEPAAGLALTVSAEAVLGAAVLAVTAVLTGLARP